jgi:hypothetical protein
MSSACARQDLTGERIAWVLWGLPAVALVLGAALGQVARTIIWTSAFLVAGVSCVANARRCGRLHCYFTGPLYLFAAGATVLIGLGLMPGGWSWIAGVAIVGTVLAYVPEWVRGRYVGASSGRVLLVGVLLLGGVALAALRLSSTNTNKLCELADLKARFNEDRGMTRIVLLLSPT